MPLRVCGYCGVEIPTRPGGGRQREYCTDSHRVMASRLRTAEAAHDDDSDSKVRP